MRAPSDAGQASAEYVGVLALLAVVLAAAATAVAAPDLPGAVVRHLRVALCLVGGDLCRDADARAAGLEPCVRSSESHARETGVSVLVVRSAHGRAYAVEVRSDGSVVVRGTDGGTLTGTVGGPRLGAVTAGGEAEGGVFFERGREWAFPDLAAARRFLERARDPMQLTDDGNLHHWGVERAPVRYLEGGGTLGASLASQVGGSRVGVGLPGGHAKARAALGRRTGPDGTTLYYALDAQTSGALAELVPGLERDGRWVAEWHDGAPPAIVLRTASRTGDRVTERTARLELREPGDRDVALRVMLLPFSPPVTLTAVRGLRERLLARGTVERQVFAEDADEGGFDVTGRLGLQVGVDHTSSTVRRRLVDAEVLVGGRNVRRSDCLDVLGPR